MTTTRPIHTYSEVRAAEVLGVSRTTLNSWKLQGRLRPELVRGRDYDAYEVDDVVAGTSPLFADEAAEAKRTRANTAGPHDGGPAAHPEKECREDNSMDEDNEAVTFYEEEHTDRMANEAILDREADRIG